jgi:hypothetical protein
MIAGMAKSLFPSHWGGIPTFDKSSPGQIARTVLGGGAGCFVAIQPRGNHTTANPDTIHTSVGDTVTTIAMRRTLKSA